MGCMQIVFFFFKQKTAYEMLRSLVGSEMCIRDRNKAVATRLRLIARATAVTRSVYAASGRLH